jgi:hypothetical protein
VSFLLAILYFCCWQNLLLCWIDLYQEKQRLSQKSLFSLSLKKKKKNKKKTTTTRLVSVLWKKVGRKKS